MSAIAAMAAKVVSVGTAFVSVPLTLHYLGVQRYGMWMTMSSFIALMSFADFGVGSGLLTAVSKANGGDDRIAIRGLVSSAYFVLSAIAVSIAVLATLVYSFIPWPRLFNVDSSLAAQEAGPSIAVLLACFSLSIPLGIVQKVQSGLQQGFAASFWQCGASLIGLACLLITVDLQGGLPWLVFAMMGGPLLGGLANAILFFGVQASDIFPSMRLVSRSHVAQISHTGAYFFVLQILVAVTYSSDNILIAQLLGPEKVAEYAVSAQIFNVVPMVLMVTLGPLWPAYTEAITRNDHSWIKQTLIKTTLGSFCFAAFASTVLIAFGPAFFALWLGRQISPPFQLLLALALYKIVESTAYPFFIFLNGANMLRLQLVLSLSVAVIAVILKIILVKQLGVAGTTWGTVIATLCVAPTVAIYTLRRYFYVREN